MIELQYDYHDANLVSASFGPRREASLVFALYPIFYPERPTVTLWFGGLFNDDATSRFVSAINADPADDDSYLARCNTIQIDTKKPSNDGNIYVFIDLEYFGQIRVHCKHISEIIAST